MTLGKWLVVCFGCAVGAQQGTECPSQSNTSKTNDTLNAAGDQFMLEYTSAGETFNNAYVKTTWTYYTNITDENEKAANQADKDAAAFTLEWTNNALGKFKGCTDTLTNGTVARGIGGLEGQVSTEA